MDTPKHAHRHALYDCYSDKPLALLARAFHVGSVKQQRIAAQAALLAGADIDAPVMSDGATQLMSACACGYTDAVKILCELGADVHKRRGDGATALWVACVDHGQHQEAMRALLAHGARIDDCGPGHTDLLSYMGRTRGRPDVFASAEERVAILERERLGFDAISTASKSPSPRI